MISRAVPWWALLLVSPVVWAGCLDPNTRDAPSAGGLIGTPYVDAGIPYDPRRAPPIEGDAGDSDTDQPDDASGPPPDAPDAGDDVAPTPDCVVDADCAPPLVCRPDAFDVARCVPECEIASECGEGRTCQNLVCVDVECIADDDCDALTEVCAAGLCGAPACNQVLFVYDDGESTPTTVHVAGDFNATAGEWPGTIAAGGWALTYDAGLDRWIGRFDVPLDSSPTGTWEYKLVLDETTYITDPANENQAPDPFGGFNSVLTLTCTPDDGSGVCGDVSTFDWRDAVMYFVMTDRFYDADGTVDPVAGATGGDAATGPSGQFEGGDLRGVIEKMDYLTDLGVTALWLSAPYDNRNEAGAAIDPVADPRNYSAYHGYWPSPANISFANPEAPSPRPRVEARLGTEQDLRDLVAAAHGAESVNGHGVRVLFDYVMNHVDSNSGLYQANPNWFARRDGEIALCGPDNLWDDPFWGVRCAFTNYLPPFDFDNAAARAWSVADAVWWAREFGIDGYRLDAIKHVPMQWLIDVRAALDLAFPDPVGGRFYLVGETFAYDDRDLLAAYVDPETKLDGQFDFPMKARLCEALFTPGGRLSDFAGWMAGNDTFYGPNAIMTTWIGNHDIPRAIHFASRQIGNCREGSFPANGWSADFPQPSAAAAYERLGLSFVVMMANPGVPLIYYGDEIGLAGGGDPDNRRLMPWEDEALLPAQRALRDTVSTLARLRAENPVLSRGRRVSRSADQDTWVWSMVGCEAASRDVTVAINRSDAARTVSLPAGNWEDLVATGVTVSATVEVPARGWRMVRRVP